MDCGLCNDGDSGAQMTDTLKVEDPGVAPTNTEVMISRLASTPIHSEVTRHVVAPEGLLEEAADSRCGPCLSRR